MLHNLKQTDFLRNDVEATSFQGLVHPAESFETAEPAAVATTGGQSDDLRLKHRRAEGESLSTGTSLFVCISLFCLVGCLKRNN